ncbi:hypothetical protein LC724_38110 [Blautia sp. RD014234]|nr:hypothetical protein [Blautia parvula]
MASKDEEMVVGDKSLENIYEKTKNEAFLDGHSVEDMQQAAKNQEKLVSLIQEGEQEYYVTQTPFGYNGWTLLSAMKRGRWIPPMPLSGLMQRGSILPSQSLFCLVFC